MHLRCLHFYIHTPEIIKGINAGNSVVFKIVSKYNPTPEVWINSPESNIIT